MDREDIKVYRSKQWKVLNRNGNSLPIEYIGRSTNTPYVLIKTALHKGSPFPFVNQPKKPLDVKWLEMIGESYVVTDPENIVLRGEIKYMKVDSLQLTSLYFN